MEVPDGIARSRTREPVKPKHCERMMIQFDSVGAGSEEVHPLAFLADDAHMNRHNAELYI